jgi:hypothetical protein
MVNGIGNVHPDPDDRRVITGSWYPDPAVDDFWYFNIGFSVDDALRVHPARFELWKRMGSYKPGVGIDVFLTQTAIRTFPFAAVVEEHKPELAEIVDADRLRKMLENGRTPATSRPGRRRVRPEYLSRLAELLAEADANGIQQRTKYAQTILSSEIGPEVIQNYEEGDLIKRRTIDNWRQKIEGSK